jgi:hypothetical protein
VLVLYIPRREGARRVLYGKESDDDDDDERRSGAFYTSDDIGVELKGVRSGVERR